MRSIRGSLPLLAVALLAVTASANPQTKKLSGPLVRDGLGDVYAHVLSPDGARAVYRASHDDPQALDLYSVPVDGSAPAVRLNPPLVAGGNVEWPPLFSPDSSRVVYVADQDVDGMLELYSVPLAGGTVVKLNAPLIPAGDVGSPGP